MELGISAVECRTRNQVSPGSKPPLLPFRRVGIFVVSIDAPVDTAVFEYLAIDSGENGIQIQDSHANVVAHTCCMTRMLPREAELVSE